MSNAITLRAATAADLPTLDMFAAAEGMDAIPSAENVHVACNEAGEIVGFIRLVFSEEGTCHVSPVVVYPTWRGLNVGTVLMEFARSHGEVRLVARGTSKAFYEALGFAPLAWEQIHPPLAAACSTCEMCEECNPQPMGIGAR